MPAFRTAAIWTDVTGNTRLTTINTDGTDVPLLAALGAVSNGGIVTTWQGPIVTLTPGTLSGTYQDVRDSALLLFQDTAGDYVKIYLPSPKLLTFLPDGVTVDPVAVAAIVAAMVANGRSAANLPIASYVGGVYQRNAKILQGG